MANERKVTVVYQPKEDGAKLWRMEVPEAQAAKMVKLGRWKYPSNSASPQKSESNK
jgi:hypothetical protein